jgi:transcriptional regulator with XRE-family HTH domain
MQAISLTEPVCLYNLAMKTGRPSKQPRPAFGDRLHALREAAGLSQAQVAEKLGIAQRTYSHWERRPVALRHDQLEALAAALGLPLAELVGTPEAKPRGTGPVGKAKALFNRVSALPRDRQQRILTTVEDMLIAHEARKAG